MKRSIRLISAPGRPLLVICLILLMGCIGTSTAYAQWYSLLTLDVRPSYSGDKFFVGPAGDLDNDGFDDFFVGEPNYSAGQGYLKVVYGSEEPDTVTGWIAQIPNAHPSYFGAWADVIGDMDGDGYDEIAIGAPLYGPSYWGLVFLYETEPFDTLYDHYFSGEYDGFGSFHAAGDFNNDGYHDLLVGEGPSRPYYLSVGAYLYFGSPELDTEADWQLVNNVDEYVGGMQMIPGSGGDFDGDEYDDFSISKLIFYSSDSMTTQSFFFSGGREIDTIPDFSFTDKNIIWVGDINNDRLSDFMATIYNDDSVWVKIYYGNQNGDTLHTQILYDTPLEPGDLKFQVRSFSDFNDDGHSDLLVLRGPDHERYYTYTAELLFGGTQLDTIPDEVFGIANIFRSIADIGDINGDGIRELLVKQSFGSDSLVTSIFARNNTFIDDGMASPLSPILDLKAYPNPFNSSMMIRFSLEAESYVELAVFDILGRKIDELVNRRLEPGYHQVEWNAADRPSGVYFYRLVTRETAVTGRMTLLR